MRVAQIAPLGEAIPPKFYGGTERVVSCLTEALVEAGHDVTLFASGDSQTSAKLESIWPQSLRLDPEIRDRMAPLMLLLAEVHRRAHEFDILHFHLDYFPFPLFTNQPVPFVTTLHGRLDLLELQPIFSASNKALVVSVSNSQRGPMPQANWLATIYHGLPEAGLMPKFHADPQYLAFLGRISPEKRVDKAIRIAEATGMKIKIAAKIDDVDRQYFEEEIKDLFKLPQVEYIGEIREEDKSEFLGNAFGLLFPIGWLEPFGLVMIEAMACGIPVVAFNHGSVPKVIEDGISGFIVEDEEVAIAAVKRLNTLSRAEVRKSFEKRFTSEIMAKRYIQAYNDSIELRCK